MAETPAEPTLTILTPRSRGGRPRNPEPSSTICTWVPASEHDRLLKLADAHELSLSALVRLVLKRCT